MNKQKKGFIHIGFSSILMVFNHVMSGDFCDALSDHCKFRLQIKS